MWIFTRAVLISLSLVKGYNCHGSGYFARYHVFNGYIAVLAS